MYVVYKDSLKSASHFTTCKYMYYCTKSCTPALPMTWNISRDMMLLLLVPPGDCPSWFHLDTGPLGDESISFVSTLRLVPLSSTWRQVPLGSTWIQVLDKSFGFHLETGPLGDNSFWFHQETEVCCGRFCWESIMLGRVEVVVMEICAGTRPPE